MPKSSVPKYSVRVKVHTSLNGSAIFLHERVAGLQKVVLESIQAPQGFFVQLLTFVRAIRLIQ